MKVFESQGNMIYPCVNLLLTSAQFNGDIIAFHLGDFRFFFSFLFILLSSCGLCVRLCVHVFTAFLSKQDNFASAEKEKCSVQALPRPLPW